jgi:integrase
MHKDPTAGPSDGGRKLTTTRWPGIYKRGTRYVVRVRDHRGRQIQRAAKTVAEARYLRAELLADVVRGEYRSETKLTLSQYASSWVTTYKGRTGTGIRPHTLAEYARDLDLHVLPRLGKLRLSEITTQEVKALVTHLENKPNARDAARTLSPGTIRNALAPLRALLATAVEEGLIRANPMAGMRLAGRRTEPGDRRVLTDAELAALLDGAKPGAPQLLLRLLAESGLRIGEAVALQWTHVDLDAGRLLVRQRRYRETTDTPKSAYGRRDIPIGRALLRDLREHKLASHHSQGADYVFVTRTGTPWRPENARRRVLLPACEAAEITPIGFHVLRHTAITRWFLAGIDPKRVQIMAGHHDVAFTLNTYTHVLPSQLPSLDVMDALGIPVSR